MTTPQKHLYRLSTFALVASVVLAQALLPTMVSAQIENRKLTLMAGATDGGSRPSGVVRHEFEFTPGTAGLSVGSIKFQYCTTAADAGSNTCVTPTGLSTTSSTLEFEDGATGFSLNNTVNGEPYLTRTASTVSGTPDLTYRLATVTNPSTVGTFFVRILMYSTTDATGTPVDFGSVAASTAEQIVLDGTMPESLVFCTGETIGLNGSSVPDCSTATPGSISFNQLFSPTDTAVATSQMAASTNAGFGYAITVNGPTLTSGSNTISPMTTATTADSTRGTSRFGLNLKANTTATSTNATGTEVAPAANGTNYKGQASTGYDAADTFKFTTGDVIAASDNGGLGGTDAQIYTATYVANVPGSQPAGTYTTTLTYICTPTF